MIYQIITKAVQYGNHLFNSYPTFFHALLPIGTIFTAALGMKNSNRLEKQANLQREIEGNRYKLDLFDKRFKIWTEFQSMVATPPGPIYEATHAELISISEKVKENMKYTKKAILLFSPDEKFNVLHDFNVTSATFDKILNIAIASKKTIIDAQRDMEKAQEEQASYEEGSIGYISKQNVYNLKEKIINQVHENMYEHNQALIQIPTVYNKQRLECESYMESLLSAPKQAFDDSKKIKWFKPK